MWHDDSYVLVVEGESMLTHLTAFFLSSSCRIYKLNPPIKLKISCLTSFILRLKLSYSHMQIGRLVDLRKLVIIYTAEYVSISALFS